MSATTTILTRGERVALTLRSGRRLVGLITYSDERRVHLQRLSPITADPMNGCSHRVNLSDVERVEPIT